MLGVDGNHVPVDIDNNGLIQDDDNDHQPTEIIDDEAEQNVQPRINYDKIHVSRKAVQKYGPIEGSPACKAIVKHGHMTGRIGYNHSGTCRARILESMKSDPEYRNLVQKHDRQREETDIEMITTEQMEETRGHVRKAMHQEEQKVEREGKSSIFTQLDKTTMGMLIANVDVTDF